MEWRSIVWGARGVGYAGRRALGCARVLTKRSSDGYSGSSGKEESLCASDGGNEAHNLCE